MEKSYARKIFDRLDKFYGFVQPGLEYSDIYELTVSVVLSAQTTDKQINKITPRLFAKYPDFNSLKDADLPEVEEIIRSIGFFRTKALNIIRLSRQICTEFNNKVPESIEELTKLAGVGRKSANVILAQGHGVPGLAVDTHVKRISRRLGYTDQTDPDKIEAELKNLFPPEKWSRVHLVIIHHGRNICKARNPKCRECPVFTDCSYPDKIF